MEVQNVLKEPLSTILTMPLAIKNDLLEAKAKILEEESKQMKLPQ